jgi:hypothetical protein
MREILVKKDDNTTVVIKSPWLSRSDAAFYLDISMSEFFRKIV